MKNSTFRPFFVIAIVQLLLSTTAFSQYKEYKISVKGDTINAVSKSGLKEGKWVISVPELRGNPGYEEEGIYRKGQKEGFWRQYSIEGDLLAVENYSRGGKDGLQLYYNFRGNLEREENWRAFNPDSPFDTIAVYGTGSNDIIDYKIVKAETYSVKNGDWRYYDPETGALMRSEKWDRNVLVPANATKPAVAAATEKKKVEKTAEMLEWEKKNRGKKGAVRDGRTGL